MSPRLLACALALLLLLPSARPADAEEPPPGPPAAPSASDPEAAARRERMREEILAKIEAGRKDVDARRAWEEIRGRPNPAETREATDNGRVGAAATAPPKTRTVDGKDPDNDNDLLFTTIQAAIDASGPGDTVKLADLVFSGPGNRDLVIPPDRDGLKLTGSCGPNTAHILAFDGGTAHNGIAVSPARARIECLVILHPRVGISTSLVAEGLQVSKVVVEGAADKALYVNASGPLVQNSQFLAGANSGVTIAGDLGGRFLTNTIRFFGGHCLALDDATDTLVQGNRVSGCGGHGIAASFNNTTDSGNRYQGNTLSEVGGTCIHHSSTGPYALVGQDARGAGQPNRISGCAGNGVMATGNDVLVRGNTIEGVGASGVELHGPRASVTGNRVTGATAGGIVVGSDDGLVQGNTVLKADGTAIWVQGDRAKVIGNRVTAAGASGIAVFRPDVTIEKNTVTETGVLGIFADGTNALIRGNLIRNTREEGILVSSDRSPRVLANTVANAGLDGGSRGIWVVCGNAQNCDRNDGGNAVRGEVAGNVVSGVVGNDGITVVVTAGGMIVRANRVTDVGGEGLTVQMSFGQVGGPAAADGNVVTRAALDGIWLLGDVNTVRNNTAQYGGGRGLFVKGHDNEILGNRASHNSRGGITLENGGAQNNQGNNTAIGNTALGNRADGIENDAFFTHLEKNASSGNLKGFNCSNDPAGMGIGSTPEQLATNNCGGEGKFDHPSSGID